MLVPITIIDNYTPPPVGWPVLREIVIHDFWEAQRACKAVPPLRIAFMCSVVNFCTMTHTIYTGITPGTEAYEAGMIHERDHGLGKDHIGESTNRDYYAAWKPWLDKGVVPSICKEEK